MPENFEDEAARIGGPRSAAFTARALPPEVIAAYISLDIYICICQTATLAYETPAKRPEDVEESEKTGVVRRYQEHARRTGTGMLAHVTNSSCKRMTHRSRASTISLYSASLNDLLRLF